ncbi:sugar ABC transporter substrate-binding protein [Oscillochloris sp. ZM17-4]|uniref:ABC transporter substrate-binding protein n=1 Tax=Oscillochloris sp. ZM17-4 TaxID=2866714 RepID=UPI0021035FFB|nr:sugar ABC transporter substrate-binding protein [Oscillochloris sp. ZM17-4]
MRRICLLLALLAAALLAGACAAPAAPVSFMIFGDPAERAAYADLVAAFRERRPDIAVELIYVPSQSDYRKRLGVDLAAGKPADVVLINYRRYAGFAAGGALEPLGPYLARSELIQEDDFYPQALGPFRWGGELMCIPQNLSSLVVYYNQALFAEAGLAEPADDWTWDDFLRAAQALTRDTDGDGRVDQYGVGTDASLFRVAPFIWQNGGDLVDNPAAPTRLALDSPQAREALQWFVDLQVRHHVAPDAVQEQAESSESRFLSGRLGMYLNSRRGVPTYRTITGFGWDVAPLPRGRQAAGILHADAYCLPSASRQKGLAWALIEFANASEGQAIIARSGRTVPSIRAVAESPAFLDPQVAPSRSRVFIDTIPVIRAVPVMESWADIEDAVGEEIERAFYGNASVDEVIAEAARRTAPFFAR